MRRLAWFLLLIPLALLAQEAASVSQASPGAIDGLLNTPFRDLQLNGLTAIVLFKLVGEVFSAIRKGGGLRRILFSIWFGENIPAPIAADYKRELSRAPFQKTDEHVP